MNLQEEKQRLEAAREQLVANLNFVNGQLAFVQKLIDAGVAVVNMPRAPLPNGDDSPGITSGDDLSLEASA